MPRLQTMHGRRALSKNVPWRPPCQRSAPTPPEKLAARRGEIDEDSLDRTKRSGFPHEMIFVEVDADRVVERHPRTVISAAHEETRIRNVLAVPLTYPEL